MALIQSASPVIVVNLDEINRNLKALGPAINTAAKLGMLEGAEPIRRDAEDLARSDISGMRRRKTSDWSAQREGSTIHEVYIAPVERGRKSRNDSRRRRPNFVYLMFGKSYDPALERGTPGVVAAVDKWLGSVTREF